MEEFIWFEQSSGKDVYVNPSHIVSVEESNSPKEEIIIVTLSNGRVLCIPYEENYAQLTKLGIKF